MKRGPKTRSQPIKDAFDRMRANIRLAMEFDYGTRKKPGTSLKEDDDRNQRREAKNTVGDMFPSIPTYAWYERGKQASERVNPTPWHKLKKLHREWSHTTIEIGLAESMKHSIQYYNKPNKSADKAISILRGFSKEPPTGEDAFYTLLKLKISPDTVWPEELKNDKHLLYLMTQFQNIVAFRQPTLMEAESVLKIAIIAQGNNTASSELGKGIENFLKPLFRTLTASVNGTETFFEDVINWETGTAMFVPHPDIAAKIEQDDGSYKIIYWREIESILDE